MEELRMLEADEKAAVNRKSSWKIEETALGNSAAVVNKGATPGRKTCWIWCVLHDSARKYRN
eukprot:10210526-Prorocentrum_lima.AAC.1